MEQDVQDEDKLLLRFKYHVFFDLNPKVGELKEPERILCLLNPLKWEQGRLELRCTVCVCVCVF